ncbi:MAG: oligosaccharide flippase family protein, partial [Clostridia bacterium]|nr:oligosaccharide flippase family protein [Clostridia bacterium]
MSKSLVRAVAIVAIFSVLTRAIGFLFRIYLSRELGAELLGVYYAAFSVFMVLVVVVSSGIPLAISKMTAVYRVRNNRRA